MPDLNRRVIGRIAARWQAATDSECLYLLGDDGFRPYTGAELLDLASRYAGGFIEQGVQPGDRVGLVLQTGESFIGACFGAWWAGAGIVPLAPPMPRQDPDEEAARIRRALTVAKPRVTVVDADVQPLLAGTPGVLLAPDRLPGSPLPEPLAKGDLAIVQFSSGSTGHPKGVTLGDAQVIANLEGITAALQPRPGDKGVSWLPLYHDMGLIGSLIWTQFVGMPTAFIPPAAFIFDPGFWLQTISDFKASFSVAPNFAYQLCSRLSAARLEGIDLASWRVTLVGAEPIRPDSLAAFAKRLAPYGFRKEAFVPCYGLAEATVCVSMTPPGEGPSIDRVLRTAYHETGAALPAGEADEDALKVPAVGRVLHNSHVSIRDAEGNALPERRVGEIWVQSPSVTTGYFDDPEATAAVLTADGWLRTGDLGYMAGDRLYVSGRIKDVIIRGGCKYHPQDLEAAAESDAAVRKGGTAAFRIDADQQAPDRVVVLAEVRDASQPTGELPHELRARIQEATGLRVDDVVLVRPYQLPKTTSGKIRRTEARRLFLAGALERVDG